MATISKIKLIDGTTYDIKDTTYENATASVGGLMSSADKTKLDGIDAGAVAMVVLSYGNSTWADFEDAFNKNAVIYCKASSNSNPASGTQSRYAFMAYKETNKVEFQYYRSQSSPSQSSPTDEVYVYTLNNSTGWSVTVRTASPAIFENGTHIQTSYVSDSRKYVINSTLRNEDAVSGGTDVSLVSTGDKYRWNNMVPAVTSTDNGKVLRVVNGAWTAVSLPSASGVSF